MQTVIEDVDNVTEQCKQIKAKITYANKAAHHQSRQCSIRAIIKMSTQLNLLRAVQRSIHRLEWCFQPFISACLSNYNWQFRILICNQFTFEGAQCKYAHAPFAHSMISGLFVLHFILSACVRAILSNLNVIFEWQSIYGMELHVCCLARKKLSCVSIYRYERIFERFSIDVQVIIECANRSSSK